MGSDPLYEFRCRRTGVVKAYKRMSRRKAEARNELLSAEGSTHRWTAVLGTLPDKNGSRPQEKRRATAAASAPRVAPADKRLVYEVKEGRELLCAFLGVPVPDAPFSQFNDSAAFDRQAGC